MATDRARYDINLKPTLIAVSSTDGETPVTLWADPTTHALVTSGGGGGSSGTQYATGTAVATPTGTVSLGFDGSNVRALKTDTSGNLIISSTNVVDTAGNDNIATGNITAADIGSTSATGQSSQTIWTGTPTANSTAVLTFPTVNSSPESQSNVVIHITGTFVGTYVFERSPDSGTTWTSFNCFVAGTATTLNTGTAIGMFHGNVAGTTNVRVRCTSYTSGTISVRLTSGIGTGTITVGNPVRLANTSFTAIDPATSTMQSTMDGHLTDGTQQARLTDGTNVANVLKSDGTSAGKNAVFAASANQSISFTSSGTGAQAIGPWDVSAYQSISIQNITIGTGLAAAVQFSNDGGTTWVTSNTPVNLSSTTFSPNSSTSGTSIYTLPRQGASMRINVTALTSGTYTGNIFLTSNPHPVQSMGVAALSTTGAGTPSTAFYVAGSQGGNLVGLTLTAGTADNTSGTLLFSAGLGYGYNGSNWDRNRNNITTALIAAGTTTTQTGITLTTYNLTRLMLLLNVSAVTGGTVTVAINTVSTSGYTTNLLTSTAIGTTGVTPLRVFPGATPSANLVANDMIGRTISVTATVSGTITYGIDTILGAN